MFWDITPVMFWGRNKKNNPTHFEDRGCPYHTHWITQWLQTVWWGRAPWQWHVSPSSPLSRSLLSTELVSALVLMRGQVLGSQASIRYTAGGIPAAHRWNDDNFSAGHFVSVTDILPFTSTSGVWENVEESSSSNNLGSCLMCNE